MRELFSAIFIVIIVALTLCGLAARRSTNPLGKPLSNLIFVLILPISGNLIIASSQHELLSTIGCYVYFLGMDVLSLALIRYTFLYCGYNYDKVKKFIYAFVAVDIIQYGFNPFFGQAFGIELIMVGNHDYYRFVPEIGQIFHRIVCYGIYILSFATFIHKGAHVSKVYVPKYFTIITAMLIGGAWQSYYIFSRTPVDRSMIGYGLFGLLIFYFTLFYRPLKLIDSLLANITTKMAEAAFFFDNRDRCIWCNTHGQKLLDVKEEYLSSVPQRLEKMFGSIKNDEEKWTKNLTIKVDGQTKHYTLERQRLFDTRNRYVGAFLLIRDNTEQEIKHRKALYDATHDKLTGLYTKEYIYSLIHDQLSKNKETTYSIAFFDLKEFKLVNDVFGHDTGDKVLLRVANWLRDNAKDQWIYGRISGDAFGVCFPNNDTDLSKIEKRLSKFVLSSGSTSYNILMHIGIYNVDDYDLDVSVMFDRAHLAQRNIRNEFNKHIAIYDKALREQTLWAQKISADLEKALLEKQIRPFLQPIVDNNGKIIGAEALVRWFHPVEGFLPPIKFIPIFEKNGMIADVDKYIWREACRIIASWKGIHDDLFISINISPKDFYFMDVYKEILNLTTEFNIEPKKLRIEITETVMITEVEKRMKILSQFRESGFIVEMDDFGSGYSSLNQLKKMPLDVLKIDMKFLGKTSENDLKAETILRSVLHMSKDLGLCSLTEGVETEDQYQMLNKMGCNLFQGYYFAKPMPLKEFEALCS